MRACYGRLATNTFACSTRSSPLTTLPPRIVRGNATKLPAPARSGLILESAFAPAGSDSCEDESAYPRSR
jgi:hypothetical protein